MGNQRLLRPEVNALVRPVSTNHLVRVPNSVPMPNCTPRFVSLLFIRSVYSVRA